MTFLKYLSTITAGDYCRQDVLTAEQCLSNVCERPNPYPYCPPYYCYEKPCVPSELACQVLVEIEILLRAFTGTLTTAVTKDINREFNDLYNALLAADLRADNEIIDAAEQLEEDIKALIDTRFRDLGFSLASTIRTDFGKAKAAGDAALTAAKADIASRITALAALPDADIIANLQDTTNGFQAQALAAANSIAASYTTSYVKQEKDILSKISQGITSEKAIISAAINRLFKEFEKTVRSLDATYAAAAKRLIDNTKAKLESEINDEISELAKRNEFIILSLLRGLIRKETGCDVINNIIPLSFLTSTQSFTAPQPVVY